MPHPRYLARMLTAEDLAEWAIYAELEDFGEQAADRRAAAQIAAFFEIHRDSSKQASRFRWEQVLHWVQPSPPVAPLELEADAQVAIFDRMFGVIDG